MLPSLSLPPLECCFGTSPIQAEKLRPDRKVLGSATLATRAVASIGPTPGMQMKALARLVGPVPGYDHPIELQNLLLQAEQLGTERGKAPAGNLMHSPVVRVGNNVQQFRDSFTPDRRDNAKLGKVRPDRINHRSLLANEQMTSAVKHQAALLLRRLGWHEPHVGSGDRLANRLSVGHVG